MIFKDTIDFSTNFIDQSSIDIECPVCEIKQSILLMVANLYDVDRGDYLFQCACKNFACFFDYEYKSKAQYQKIWRLFLVRFYSDIYLQHMKFTIPNYCVLKRNKLEMKIKGSKFDTSIADKLYLLS